MRLWCFGALGVVRSLALRARSQSARGPRIRGLAAPTSVALETGNCVGEKDSEPRTRRAGIADQTESTGAGLL